MMRVLIVEDSVLLRAGIGRLLEDEDIEVVGEAGDAESFLTAWETHRPDLSIVDVRMPPTHTDEGIRASVELRAQHPDAKILVLSQYVEERYAKELLADGHGGVGYLLKERIAANAAIAEQLIVSSATVEKHTSAIFQKLMLEQRSTDHRRVLAVLQWLDK